MTEDELRDWAAERVAEPAAAPKAVTVLDALPVTAVGKPYKLPLRADATRRELSPTRSTGSPGAHGRHRRSRTAPSSATVDRSDSPADEARRHYAILDRYAGRLADSW